MSRTTRCRHPLLAALLAAAMALMTQPLTAHTGAHGAGLGLAGLSPAAWQEPVPSIWKVRRGQRPTPSDRTVAVVINEQACASGQPASGRILEPIVEPTERSITITIPVRQLGDVLMERQLTGLGLFLLSAVLHLDLFVPGTGLPSLGVGVRCPGNPWTPYVVELEEPIGERILLDGGVDPPEQRWPRRQGRR